MDEIVINIEVIEEDVSVQTVETVEVVDITHMEAEEVGIHELRFNHLLIPTQEQINEWDSKAEGDHDHNETYSDINHNHDLSYEPKKGNDDNYVTDTEKSQLHAPHSDDQDLSNLVVKETGKGLSTNDLTNELKTGYDDAVSKKHTHTNNEALNAVSGINTGDQDLSGLEPKKGVDDLYVTSAEKEAWNGKAEVSHTHEGYAASDHTHDLSAYATTSYVNGIVGDIETILISI